MPVCSREDRKPVNGTGGGRGVGGGLKVGEAVGDGDGDGDTSPTGGVGGAGAVIAFQIESVKSIAVRNVWQFWNISFSVGHVFRAPLSA